MRAASRAFSMKAAMMASTGQASGYRDIANVRDSVQGAGLVDPIEQERRKTLKIMIDKLDQIAGNTQPIKDSTNNRSS